MPYEQWCRMVDALFEGRPDMFHGHSWYFYHLSTHPTQPGIYDKPDDIDWDNFWDSFTRAISLT